MCYLSVPIEQKDYETHIHTHLVILLREGTSLGGDLKKIECSALALEPVPLSLFYTLRCTLLKLSS
jgi:predicted DNA-binding protein with PD1-like motif